MKNRNRKL